MAYNDPDLLLSESADVDSNEDIIFNGDVPSRLGRRMILDYH